MSEYERRLQRSLAANTYDATGRGQGFFPAEPRVRFLTNGMVRLEQPLVYIDKYGLGFLAAPFESDLESRPTGLPGFLNRILGPTRETALAALIHDMLCNREDVPRATSDDLYHEMLLFLHELRAPTSTLWQRFRRRIAAPLSWAGMRARAWVLWIP